MFQYLQVFPEFIGGLIKTKNCFKRTRYVPKEIIIQGYPCIDDRQHGLGDLFCSFRCLTERIQDRVGSSRTFVAFIGEGDEFYKAPLGGFIAVLYLHSGKGYVSFSIRDTSLCNHVGASNVTRTTLEVITLMEHQEDTLKIVSALDVLAVPNTPLKSIGRG